MSERGAYGLPFLPESAKAFLKRRASELGGLVILAAAIALALALATYSPADPSPNHATAATPANWLGYPGAGVADVILQTLGLGGILLVLAPAAWAWRLIAHRGLPWLWLHLAALPLALLAASFLAATLPGPASWPLQAGLGGVLGQEAVDLAHDAATLLHLELSQTVLRGMAVVLALATAGLSFGLGRYEWAIIARLGRWSGGLLWRASGGMIGAARRRQPTEKSAPVRTRPARVEPRPERAAKAEGAPAPKEADSARVIARAAKSAIPQEARSQAPAALDLEPAGEMPLPPLSLLAEAKNTDRQEVSEEALQQNARNLEAVLDDYGIKGEILRVRPGPVVTLYELEPAPGIKSSRVIGLADDIARSMSAIAARVAVIPGRNAIGIELPNATREPVALRELLASAEYEKTAARLTLVLGKDIGGVPIIADLARMPHLLIAGTTGSGKSVAINAMILSLLYRLPPDQCKLILIDPKMLELSAYDDIPHLLTPVVTEPKKAVVALKWTVREMEERYRKMSKLGVRNIAGYNQRVQQARESGEALKRTVQTGFDPETGKPVFEEQEMNLAPMPFIVVVVDEMADLMMVAGKDIEGAIQRLAQMARAAGIHIIMATQRPSVDVITGTIKANFPTRISFQVTSKIDSRTILGEQGAEQLLGQGDMLYMAGGARITRVHGPFVSDDEVERVTQWLRQHGAPDYLDAVTEETDGDFGGSLAGEGGESDDLYDRAVAAVVRNRKASTSFIQRQLQIGYNRAARLMEQMEEQGVVGPANHVGRREILVREGAED